MLIVELRHALYLSNTRNYGLVEDLAQRIQLASILGWKTDTLALALTLRNKGREGTLPPTSLIGRLSAMPLLEAECTSLVSWVLIIVS